MIIPAIASEPSEELFNVTGFDGNPAATIVNYQRETVRQVAVDRLGIVILDEVVTAIPFLPARRPESRPVRFYGLNLRDPELYSRVRLSSFRLGETIFPGTEKKEKACIRELL